MTADKIKRGSYRGANIPASVRLIAVPFGCFAACLILSNLGVKLDIRKIMPVLCVVFFAVGALVSMFPSSWRADSEGFTITTSLLRWRFRYEDIQQIDIGNKVTWKPKLKFGASAAIVMTITCRSGKVVEFTEYVPAVNTGALGDPIRNSSLAELCEYVDRVKEEGV